MTRRPKAWAAETQQALPGVLSRVPSPSPRSSTAVGLAAAVVDTIADTRVDVELDALDVSCIRHPDRAQWFVVVWPPGARARARAEGRGPEGDVIASATYVDGNAPKNWRVRQGADLTTSQLAIVGHAVVRAIAAYSEEVARGSR